MTINLDNSNEGEKYKIYKIDAGRGLEKRLKEMGLHPDEIVEIIKNDGVGPIIVLVKDTKVALGRGMAHKILVNNIEEKVEN